MNEDRLELKDFGVHVQRRDGTGSDDDGGESFKDWRDGE